MRNLLIIFFSLFCVCPFHGQESILSLNYEGKSLAGLIGDGKSLVRTTPCSFTAVRGINLAGVLLFRSEKDNTTLSDLSWNSLFFPGGVEYTAFVSDGEIRVLYGVLPQNGYTIGVETPASIKVEMNNKSLVKLNLKFEQINNRTITFYTQNTFSLPDNYQEMKKELYKSYTQALVLQSPDTILNKAVVFSQYLLDLSYNGDMMLCELFRWLDTWARDLGSGLLPGALTSGRAGMARKSLDYDLARYALMNPSDCKNSNDPSQGGTSSGIGWTARSIWKYYLYSGDREILRKDADIIRPWVKHWIERDYDEDGLIIDVTEFMDHMIMMLTTNGVTTLAANAMYAGLLHNFSLIENELDNKEASQKLQELYERTVHAINSTYWNEEKGYFNNMMLWGIVSERSSQASQSMLLKIGATDFIRARRTLDFLKGNNWNEYGSITIIPRMNHVSLRNDQNMKVWPWWNLWESEARFGCEDKEGGYHLLKLAASTIQDEKYPGLLEETLNLDGTTYGGNAFPTGAGNLLDVTVKDLLGVEPVKAGWRVVKVVPSVPDSWTGYTCTIPSPNGTIQLMGANGRLTVVVNDPQIKTIQTLPGTIVKGAGMELYQTGQLVPVTYRKPEKKSLPLIEEGKAVLFYDKEFHSERPDLSLETIDVNQLEHLDTVLCKKLIIPGSQLPLYTKEGKGIRPVIEHFINQGGTLLLYGATTNAKSDEDGAGILGEQGGLIDWYQYLPIRNKLYFENGINRICQEKGKMVYVADLELNKDFEGKELYLEIGQLVGLDSVYINDVLVGHYADMAQFMKQEYPTRTTYPHSHTYKRVSRMYIIRPGDAAYQVFRFGERNRLTVKLSQDALQEGLTEKNRPNIGVQTIKKGWQPIDEDIPDIAFEYPKRKGINYWGNEQFFNSWSTQNGLFGFTIKGKGIQFVDDTLFTGLSDDQLEVTTAYTDFALFSPWLFESLAYTITTEYLLYPMRQERYPCVVRLVNSETKGGFIVITPAATHGSSGLEILKKLKVELK